MTVVRTHISPTTGKRMPCTANKRPCRFSGHQMTETGAASLDQFIAEIQQPQPDPEVKHPAIRQALVSPLHWKGDHPAWWKDYQREIATHPTLPTTAELIDVIDSPVGKIAVVWQQASHDTKDSGIMTEYGHGIYVLQYHSFETGEQLGYMKMEYADDATLAYSYGNDEFTPFRFAETHLGLGWGRLGMYEWRPQCLEFSGEELLAKRRDLWYRVHSAEDGYTPAGGQYIASYELSESDIPADDAIVAHDLSKFRQRYEAMMAQEKQTYAKPFIAFSRVSKTIKGTGLGTAMYVYTARALNKHGKTMRTGHSQSNDAKRVWTRLRQQFPSRVRTIRVKHHGKNSTHQTLDFSSQ